MDKQVFKLVEDNNTKECFRLFISIGLENLNLIVFKKSSCWTGNVNEQGILSFAREFEISSEEYFNQLKEYFKETPANIDFHFSKNEFIINCNSDNKMKIKYFSCKMKKADYSSQTEHLLENFYNERNIALERLEDITKEKNAFDKSKIDYEKKFIEFIESKKTDEQELYNNFVLVLNEKKKRIQHLTELLEAFKRGRPTLNPHVDIKKRTKKKSELLPQDKKNIKNEVSESSSEGSYDTDEETNRKQNLVNNMNLDNIENDKISECELVTLGSKYDLFADDSPPRHLLPKRIKSESVIQEHVLNKPSTSKSSEIKNEEKNITIDPTPNVIFNTQDLLDNL